MYANSLKYLFMNYINWERKGNFKFSKIGNYTGQWDFIIIVSDITRQDFLSCFVLTPSVEYTKLATIAVPIYLS